MQEKSRTKQEKPKVSKVNDQKQYEFPNVNRVAIAGVLAQDPPLRYTTRGVPVTNFIVITEPEDNGDAPEGMQRERCHVSVVVWAQQAIQCNKYLRKGNSVLIIGELQSMPNYEPQRSFYPVQVNAQWIQYLERSGNLVMNNMYDQSEANIGLGDHSIEAVKEGETKE